MYECPGIDFTHKVKLVTKKNLLGRKNVRHVKSASKGIYTKVSFK